MRSVDVEERHGLPSADFECTSLHGPDCRGVASRSETDPDADDAQPAEGTFVIHLQGDVDIPQIMRIFEGGLLDDAIRAAGGDPEHSRPANPGAAAGDADGAAARALGADASPLHVARHPAFAAGKRLARDANVGAEGYKSVPNRETRKVEFVNARGSASALYWVDFNGVEVHYVDLPPGMTTVMSTFAHHVWVARDMATEGAIAMYTVTPRRAGEHPAQRFVVTDVDVAAEVFAFAERRMKKDPAGAPAPAEKRDGKGKGGVETKEKMEMEMEKEKDAARAGAVSAATAKAAAAAAAGTSAAKSTAGGAGIAGDVLRSGESKKTPEGGAGTGTGAGLGAGLGDGLNAAEDDASVEFDDERARSRAERTRAARRRRARAAAREGGEL